MGDQSISSDLTRDMLNRGSKQIWCTVAHDSDASAVDCLSSGDYTVFADCFENGNFSCSDGSKWAFAVPIKVIATTGSSEGLADNGRLFVTVNHSLRLLSWLLDNKLLNTKSLNNETVGKLK